MIILLVPHLDDRLAPIALRYRASVQNAAAPYMFLKWLDGIQIILSRPVMLAG